ncbi:Coiled-coil domain-containing protein 12 [Saguinus oedipus]|uniref:Coiled-coil domain-containing protein 12 n=1 Tax=Saguinus oedipus TaxID=9490 RepID=A0ABQ9U2L1_SAGOE|nr:Coiled-coil domain-containing protein 12 [Saguinus oedipus]
MPVFTALTGHSQQSSRVLCALTLSTSSAGPAATSSWSPSPSHPTAVGSRASLELPSTCLELRLRNYVPEDEDLKKRRVPQAKPVAVEEKVKEQLEAAKPEPVIEEVDLANLAPRKPDWDLKRDVAKKLEKLKKRTQRAIAELIRKCRARQGERLKGQEDSLASAVDAATEQKACDSD